MCGPARNLDRRFICLGAGVAEIDLIKAGQFGQSRGDTFLTGNPIQVRGVPEPTGLVPKRLDKRRMRMTERVHCDATGAIEIPVAILGDQPAPFAAHESKVGASVSLHHRRSRRLLFRACCHVELVLLTRTQRVCSESALPRTACLQLPKNQTTSPSATAPVVSFDASQGCKARHFGLLCQGVWRWLGLKVSPA